MTENQEAVKAEETVQEEKAVAATQEAAAEKKEEAVNPNLRTLEVTIDGKEFQDGVTKELRRLSKKAKMPGFRPGHVPFAMVEAMYGQQASAEVINTLLEREANKAMRDGQYRVVGQFDAKPLAPAEGSSDLCFEVSFEVYPDIVLPDFSSVELKRYLCTVDDEAVNKTIDTIVKQRVTFNVEEGRAAQDEIDAAEIRKHGFKDVRSLKYKGVEFKRVQLFKTGGHHGMPGVVEPAYEAGGVRAEACGIVFRHPKVAKTLYIAGDSIWCDWIENTIHQYKPDVIFLNTAEATLKQTGKIIMGLDDIREVLKAAPDAIIIASHMDNVSHSMLWRQDIRKFVREYSLEASILVPEDGEVYEF